MSDPERDDFGERIEAYVAVLDAVDAEAAWIVGSHVPVITETIRAHPDRVSGAVLLNPASRRQFRSQVELAVGLITGSPIEAPAQRTLVAVLFTDLVDSTPAAVASGDTVWRSTLDRYEASLRRVIERHHCAVVKNTGDGALATFPSGSEAITAAIELRNNTIDLGLEGRTGIHVGEVEQRGDDIGGIAVNLAARVMGEAGPGDVVVSAAVAYTTTGGRNRLQDLGTRSLKGIKQPWQLFAVESD